jgi:hypothetical protein
MKLHQLFACAGALLLSSAAHAVVLTGSTGSNPVENFSAPGSVAFNLGLQDFGPTTLSFELEADDLAGPLGFDALVLNLAGAELNRFSFSLQGIRFAAAGTVTPSFGSLGTVKAGASAAVIEFATPEFAEFQFGDVFGNGTGELDWVLDTTGLQAGDRFTITASVPEPSTAALVLPMLCMAGLAAARRRRKD